MTGSLVSFNDLTPPAELSTAGGLVNERFDMAEVYGTDAWNAAMTYLAQIASFSFDMPWTAIEIAAVPTTGLDGIDANEPTPPDISAIDIYIPTLDAVAPEMVAVVADIGDPPNFVPTDPNFQVPEKPRVNKTKHSRFRTLPSRPNRAIPLRQLRLCPGSVFPLLRI